MIEKIALLSALLHIGIALFQLALVFGAPWGEYAWGGQHPGKLPLKFRTASTLGLMLLLSFAAVNLHVAGWMVLPFDGLSVKNLQYAVTAYAGAGAIMNFISRSKKEQVLWTPVAALLFALNWIILKNM